MATGDDDRARALRRVKWAATSLLLATAALFGVTRFLEPLHWAFGYVAAFAAAATVGGLADWYAVVALFRRPLGLAIPHTAIIPRNHQRIADNLGSFIETNFLAREAVEAKLAEVDFAGQIADWLNDRGRSRALAEFAVRMMPQMLAAIDEPAARRFIGQRLHAELNRLRIAPLAAGVLEAVTEKGRHQRLLNELLSALDRLLADEATLAKLRERIREELPTLFKFYAAESFVLRRLVASTTGFIEEARGDIGHPLRQEFDRFVQGFIERLRSSPDFTRRAEELKAELLARPEIEALAAGAWDSVRSFLESEQAGVREEFATMLVEVGRQLARDAAMRVEINRGMVRLLGEFVQRQKSGVGRFIADQVKDWDIELLIGRIELTVGRDLQYIRFNGALIGGLAGLVLYALEQAARRFL